MIEITFTRKMRFLLFIVKYRFCQDIDLLVGQIEWKEQFC